MCTTDSPALDDFVPYFPAPQRPTVAPLKNASLDFLGTLFIALVVLLPIHERIHGAAHPISGMSDDSILGYWPSRLPFYAHYRGELSRTRLIVILLMPLLVITMVSLFACAIAQDK